MKTTIPTRLAEELQVQQRQVDATIELLDGGSTVPFIARYRKEATAGLDDTQLRRLEERLTYLRALEGRRETILKSIEEQGKLTAALRAAIEGADTKVRLEDLYRPYKPKRRTKAQIAREAGLEPLARALLDDPTTHPEQAAAAFVAADGGAAGWGVADAAAALDGARQILMEKFAEDAEAARPPCAEHLVGSAFAGWFPPWSAGKEERKGRKLLATTSSIAEPIAQDRLRTASLALLRGR